MVEIAKISAKDRIEEEQVPVVVQSRLNRMPGITPLRCSETITAYLEEGHELVGRMKLTPASDERLVLMELETAGRRYHGFGKMFLSMAAQRAEAKHQELFLTAAKGVWYGHLADKYQPNSRISPVPFYASVGFEPASSVTSEELKRFENGMADYKKAKALRPAVEPEAYRRFPDKLNMVLSGQPLKALAKKGPTIPQLEPPTEWLETSEK